MIRQSLSFRPRLEALESRCVPSTLSVTSSSDGNSPFAVGTLRQEIAAARPGDTIVFDPSLDGQTITLGGGELEINKNLTIRGPGAGLLAVSGNRTSLAGGSRVFGVDAGTTVAISGLTITNGNGDSLYDPYSWNADPNEGDGGGILNLGTLSLSGCTVSNNNAGITGGDAEGGGICNYYGGSLTVVGCVVSNNTAGGGLASPCMGGGIYNAGTMVVSNSNISNNTVTFPAN